MYLNIDTSLCTFVSIYMYIIVPLDVKHKLVTNTIVTVNNSAFFDILQRIVNLHSLYYKCIRYV